MKKTLAFPEANLKDGLAFIGHFPDVESTKGLSCRGTPHALMLAEGIEYSKDNVAVKDFQKVSKMKKPRTPSEVFFVNKPHF